jgi:hypothetical protein
VSVHPRIASIENLIATDPGDRNVFGLVVADQLRLATQSLRLARRVGIVSGFFIPEAGAGETDGPPGARAVASALARMGIAVDVLTDSRNAPLFRAIGIDPVLETDGYLDRAKPTHLLSTATSADATSPKPSSPSTTSSSRPHAAESPPSASATAATKSAWARSSPKPWRAWKTGR